MTRLKKTTLALALTLGTAMTSCVNASVVMTGTRVIYPAQAQEKMVQLTNQDTHPYLVQMWLDTGNPNLTAQTADAPFIASPQVFRMNPNAGQVVRLVFTGSDLARDRESLFYLNFVQMPAMKTSELQANKLLLTVSSRLKVFYRPQALAGNPDALSQSLHFKLQGKAVIASNDSGYFATVRRADLVSRGTSYALAQASMVEPLSQANWALPTGASVAVGDTVRLTLVNDFGADVITDLPLL